MFFANNRTITNKNEQNFKNEKLCLTSILLDNIICSEGMPEDTEYGKAYMGLQRLNHIITVLSIFPTEESPVFSLLYYKP